VLVVSQRDEGSIENGVKPLRGRDREGNLTPFVEVSLPTVDVDHTDRTGMMLMIVVYDGRVLAKLLVKLMI
jgi:hypothetical protein